MLHESLSPKQILHVLHQCNRCGQQFGVITIPIKISAIVLILSNFCVTYISIKQHAKKYYNDTLLHYNITVCPPATPILQHYLSTEQEPYTCCSNGWTRCQKTLLLWKTQLGGIDFFSSESTPYSLPPQCADGKDVEMCGPESNVWQSD